jgi:hypothetical protein
MELTPALLFVMWAGGVAAGTALVAWWRVVGPGYLWLAATVTAGLAALGGLAGGGPGAWIGAALAGVGALVAQRESAARWLFAGSAAALLAAGYEPGLLSIALLATGTVLLGAVTSEMMLGHWFLVDPTLPRRPLLALDLIAAAGLVAEAVVIAVSGSLASSGGNGVLTWVWLALAILNGLLLLGVWFSLREPRYSGVMAATGLSYLAVLVTFGVVTVGRALVGGEL